MARKPRKRNYGSGGVSYDGAGWRIAVRIRGKRIQRRGYEKKEDAEAALAALTAGGRDRSPDAIAANSPPLSTLVPPWLTVREGTDEVKGTHRSGSYDRIRWDAHLADAIGDLKPHELTQEHIHDLIARKRRDGLAPATCQLLVHLIGSIFRDLMETRQASSNPARGLPKRTRVLLRSDHDPKSTPYLRTLDDVVTVYRRLCEPFRVAFAIGAFAGLRTGEIRGLHWSKVDLQNRRIMVEKTVVDGELRPPKDHEVRTVSIVDTLHPVLVSWHKKTGGQGYVCPPTRHRKGFMNERAMNSRLQLVLEHPEVALAVPGLHWYQATRHTFASHYVMNGGDIYTLSRILGHSSVTVTERYAHLSPSHVERERGRFPITL